MRRGSAGPPAWDAVSRVWRKVKSGQDAWTARSPADEPSVRLILDAAMLFWALRASGRINMRKVDGGHMLSAPIKQTDNKQSVDLAV